MSLASLIATGTKVWLDGVEPDELQKNREWGVTGATSNPTIVSKIIGRGHFDGRIGVLIGQGLTDDQIASRASWYCRSVNISVTLIVTPAAASTSSASSPAPEAGTLIMRFL